MIKAREDATIFPSKEEVNKSETKKGARSNLEERFYDKSKETQDVKVKNGFVSYCFHFKYFDSGISHNLCNDHEVDMRIMSVNKAIRALNLSLAERKSIHYPST